ncbi:MAG: tetratricopeptide repeat protein, partial [Acidobacteria bacterium]|nr:tetratricopeptide repeat protein [Acidobacteriota bacterium]
SRIGRMSCRESVSVFHLPLAVASIQLRLQQLDQAWEHGLLAADVARTVDRRVRARELLARIALARRDPEAARRQAELARDVDPTLPLPDFVRARLLHEDGRYAEALPVFERTLAAVRSRALTLPELDFYLGDTLARLDRPADAELHLREALRLAPQDTRARSALAMLYQSQGEAEAAARTIGELLEAVPTPDGYRLAAQLWEMFGGRRRAAEVRAEAVRRFGDAGR